MADHLMSPDDICFLQNVRAAVSSVMFGVDDVIDSLLVALITRGHVLLEGNPGLGKTALVKELSIALALPAEKVGRIQFTPDLMPSDITGTLMPAPHDPQRLEFQRGPIFKWLLLADEINRATPKTQSAMLEAMAERQVTVLGKKRLLTPEQGVRWRDREYRVEPPFMVMATQNPIDLEGTYDLPEAQSDRFMFKILMPFPNASILGKIISKETELRDEQTETDPPNEFDNHETLVRLHRLERGVKAAQVLPNVHQHVINMVLTSNSKFDQIADVSPGSKELLTKLVGEYLEFPLGPRAAFALVLGAKAWDVVAFTDPNSVDAVGTRSHLGLARAALPALRHRLKLRLDWERRYRNQALEVSDVERGTLHNHLLRNFVLLSAPTTGGYLSTLEADLRAAGDTES